MVVHFAIVGCGRIAERHAEQIALMGKLVAVCDIDFKKAENLALKYNAHSYSSLEEMLLKENTIEVVSICTPNYLHAQQTIYALQSGKNVLCEKPMAINSDDAKKMIEASVINNKKLFIVKSSRYTPCVEELKKCILDNRLGKIYSFQMNCIWNRPESYYSGTWKGELIKDGGTLYTQFSHYIDVLIWLLGEEDMVTGFRTISSDKNIEIEDSGAVAIKLLNGVIGTLHYSVNSFNKNQEVSFTIVAEKGTIKLGGEFMNEIVYQNPAIINIERLSNNNPANDYGTYKGSMSNHDKVYTNVIAALQGEFSSITDGESALSSVAFIEKIYQKIALSN